MNAENAAPARVKCNRGFGATFWLVMGVTALVAPFVVAQNGVTPSGKRAAIGLLIGASIILIFVLTRVLFFPRLSIDLEHGLLRTRFRTVPLSAVAAVRFKIYGRPGNWADFLGADGRVLARMALAGTFFATPTALQWCALRQAIASAPAVAGARAARTPLKQGSWIPFDTTLQALNAQVAWCAAGKRSSSRHAPIAALYGTRIALR